MKETNAKTSLCLFTSEFPFGSNETYLESEIHVMSSVFDRIYIFPSKGSKESPKRLLPEKFEVIILNDEWVNQRKILFLKNFFFIVRTIFNEHKLISNSLLFFKNVKKFKNILLHKLYLSSQLEKVLSDKKISDSVFCSYWFSDWTIILGVLKNKKKIRSFVSRAHGFDIYDNRYSDGFIPFRFFQLKMVDKVFSVSNKGAEYLKSKNVFPEKIETSYLGGVDLGENPFNDDGVFTLVSCSNVNVYKRIDLIVSALKHINFKLKWVHFGDGELLLKTIEDCKVLPENITVEFKGRVSNESILDYYKTNRINLFITTSAFEGLPMTLIEAASFGIPLMGTTVGGIPEIVNEYTGVLIPELVDPQALASSVFEFRKSDMNSLEFRRNVKKFWKNNFESKKNYTEFYKNIICSAR